MYDYYVYIVRCADQSYYTGITNNYHKRIREHNDGYNTNAYTYSRRPVELVYVSHFHNVFEAIDWETKLKGWSRKKKEAVIKGDYEALPGLAKKDFSHRRNS